MSYLSTLYNQVSEQEQPRVSQRAMLAYSIESAFGDVDRTFGLIQALDTNFNHFIAGKDVVSTESLQAYAVATQALLQGAGLVVPSAMIVPSFEAEEGATAGAAQAKKDSVIKRAIQTLKDLFIKLKNWVMSFFKKETESLDKQVLLLEHKQAEVKEAKAAVDPAKAAELKSAEFYVGVPKQWADKFTDPSKMYAEMMDNQKTLMSLASKEQFTPEDVIKLVKIKDDIEKSSTGGEIVEVAFTQAQFDSMMAHSPAMTAKAMSEGAKRIQSIIDKTSNKLKSMKGDDAESEVLSEMKTNFEAAKAAQQVLAKLMVSVKKFVALQEKAAEEMLAAYKKAS